MGQAQNLPSIARRIFEQTLKRVDAGEAVHEAVRIVDNALFVRDEPTGIDLSSPVYVVAIGKAAYQMAASLDRVVGKYIKAGIVSGTKPVGTGPHVGPAWQVFYGGHPLPNEESLEAAKACMFLLERAREEDASIVFLISGGGSAMMEMPRDPRVSLTDLRELNRVLVTSGAAIAEINSVRRAISGVKGGGLALRAPNSTQISLIVSDTRADDITSVASGPSLLTDSDIPDAMDVVEKYSLKRSIPISVVRSLEKGKPAAVSELVDSRSYVLLDNNEAVKRSVEIARSFGFVTGCDTAEHDEMIEEGAITFLNRALGFKRKAPADSPVCFVSGGEFACKVKGTGTGGRNCESALRIGLLAEKIAELRKFAFLSAGTDGIDGNSPAAGGVIDEDTIRTARSRGFDPVEYLEVSDSFTFLSEAGATIETGPTGTNVRDLRIFLAT